MQFSKEQLIEAAARCVSGGTEGACIGCAFMYTKNCMHELMASLLEIIKKDLKEPIPEVDIHEVAGRWLMPLADTSWEPGFYGRCSKCFYVHMKSTQSVPTKCPKCGSIMR